SVRDYIRLLEESMINTLAHFEVKAERHPEYVGVWVNGAKIGFIGVRISRGITYHGFSLNIDPDLNAFKLIHPCGLRNQKVTSFNEVVNKKIPLNEVMKVYLKNFSELFNTKSVVVRASLSYIPKIVESV
ncbi:MAG: lipoyl(octanoyl) transferase LipB, partial [Planctomycetota bacterium]